MGAYITAPFFETISHVKVNGWSQTDKNGHRTELLVI